MPSKKSPNNELTLTSGEAYMPRRETCIIALAYVWHHAQDRDDAILLSQALGLEHLLLPALI